MWSDYQVKHECDFIKMRPDILQHKQIDFSQSSQTFLNYESTESEVFVVIDNSGWYHAVVHHPDLTWEEPTDLDDVWVKIDVQTLYKDNDIYNQVYYGFLIVAGVVLLLLLVFLIALKCLRMKYNKLMAEKAEYKQ